MAEIIKWAVIIGALGLIIGICTPIIVPIVLSVCCLGSAYSFYKSVTKNDCSGDGGLAFVMMALPAFIIFLLSTWIGVLARVLWQLT